VSHCYSRLFFHLVWSTKYRIPYFSKEAQKKIYRFIYPIVINQRANLIAIGGIADHVHMLVKAQTNHEIENLVRIVKSKSSKFINQTNKGAKYFAWQIGYSKFSVSSSLVNKTVAYIKNQEEHHKNLTFDDEIKLLLDS